MPRRAERELKDYASGWKHTAPICMTPGNSPAGRRTISFPLGVVTRSLDAAGLASRCWVLPGNHDMCCLGVRTVRERRARASADLERVRTGLRLGRQHLRFPWVELFWGGRVAVFGLDSCNSGNLSVVTNAVGELGFVQLERLARLLRLHAGVPVKLVALHHSPNIPGEGTAERHGVPRMSALGRWGHEIPAGERRALRLLCLLAGVRLVLHGHLHRSEDRRVNGVRIVGAAASTEPVASGRRSQIRVFSISGKRLRVTTEMHHLAV